MVELLTSFYFTCILSAHVLFSYPSYLVLWMIVLYNNFVTETGVLRLLILLYEIKSINVSSFFKRLYVAYSGILMDGELIMGYS